ncbi:hypothetical protein [Paenibacillus chungangensis]|uniref:hypothetical protein n=1 Tax=Paenibacillus chungangensis TaxID=696535 RepID=UPI00366C4637
MASVVFNKDMTPEAFTPTLGTENEQYNHNPEPVLKANADNASFLSEDEIEKVAFRDKGAVPVRTELVAWGEFMAGQTEIRDHQIARDRKVWIVQTYYPDGYDTKRGRMDNAFVTGIYDSETGDVLGAIYKPLPKGEKPEGVQ